MKQLNIESTKILNKMVKMVEDGYVKINNSDGSFMSVILEVIFEDENLGNKGSSSNLGKYYPV